MSSFISKSNGITQDFKDLGEIAHSTPKKKNGNAILLSRCFVEIQPSSFLNHMFEFFTNSTC